MSSRFDNLPVSQRGSSLASSGISPQRPPTPASGGAASPALRGTRGGIYQITKILEMKHGAFFISRLILASGISLRGYDVNSYDEPTTVSKFVKTLRNMLTPADMADVFSHAPSLMTMK